MELSTLDILVILKRDLLAIIRVDQQYTSKSRWKLVYYEAYENKLLATKREAVLKKHGRVYRLLIKRINNL